MNPEAPEGRREHKRQSCRLCPSLPEDPRPHLHLSITGHTHATERSQPDLEGDRWEGAEPVGQGTEWNRPRAA